MGLLEYHSEVSKRNSVYYAKAQSTTSSQIPGGNGPVTWLFEAAGKGRALY